MGTLGLGGILLFNFLRKEYVMVIFLVIIAAIIGLAVRFSQPGIEIVYPEQDTELAVQDFVIKTENGEITIGVSSWEEVVSLFPAGEMLGLSTIYRPAAGDCLFTFTEDENILNKMHIDTDHYITNRGIKVGDSFSAIEKQYGMNYARVISKEKPDYFEAVYGTENNIVFQIQNNHVEKIILQHDISVQK